MKQETLVVSEKMYKANHSPLRLKITVFRNQNNSPRLMVAEHKGCKKCALGPATPTQHTPQCVEIVMASVRGAVFAVKLPTANDLASVNPGN